MKENEIENRNTKCKRKEIVTLGKEERERNNMKVGNWREKERKHKWEKEKTTEKNGKEEKINRMQNEKQVYKTMKKNMECKKIEFKKRQKTGKRKR